jgi:hypothetical protein
MKKGALIVMTTILSILTIVFGLAYFNRLGMEYNSEGNFFDSDAGIVYHEQAVGGYGIIALFLLTLTICTVWKLKKKY